MQIGTPKQKQNPNQKCVSKAKVSEKLIVYEVKDKENDEGLSAHFEPQQSLDTSTAMGANFKQTLIDNKQNGGKTERLKESSPNLMDS